MLQTSRSLTERQTRLLLKVCSVVKIWGNVKITRSMSLCICFRGLDIIESRDLIGLLSSSFVNLVIFILRCLDLCMNGMNNLTRIIYRNEYALKDIFTSRFYSLFATWFRSSQASYILLAGKKKLHSPLGVKQGRIDPSTLLHFISLSVSLSMLHFTHPCRFPLMYSPCSKRTHPSYPSKPNCTNSKAHTNTHQREIGSPSYSVRPTRTWVSAATTITAGITVRGGGSRVGSSFYPRSWSRYRRTPRGRGGSGTDVTK